MIPTFDQPADEKSAVHASVVEFTTPYPGDAVVCANGTYAPSLAPTSVVSGTSYTCPSCSQGGFSTLQAAAECCQGRSDQPPTAHVLTAPAIVGPASPFPGDAVVSGSVPSGTSYSCPSCSKGGFSTLQAAAECCHGKSDTPSTFKALPASSIILPPNSFSHDAVVDGSISYAAPLSSPGLTGTSYKCPSCSQGGFSTIQAAAECCLGKGDQPPMAQIITSASVIGPASSFPGDSVVGGSVPLGTSYSCPSCSKGGFSTLHAAAECCMVKNGQASTHHTLATPTVLSTPAQLP